MTKTDFEGVGVIPHINVEGQDSLPVAHIAGLRQLLEQQPDRDQAAHLEKTLQSVLSSQMPVVVPAKILESYVGVYALSENQHLTISLSDGVLRGLMTGDKQPVVASPITSTRFRVDGHGVEFTFNSDSAGTVGSLTLHQSGGIEATRVH